MSALSEYIKANRESQFGSDSDVQDEIISSNGSWFHEPGEKSSVNEDLAHVFGGTALATMGDLLTSIGLFSQTNSDFLNSINPETDELKSLNMNGAGEFVPPAPTLGSPTPTVVDSAQELSKYGSDMVARHTKQGKAPDGKYWGDMDIWDRVLNPDYWTDPYGARYDAAAIGGSVAGQAPVMAITPGGGVARVTQGLLKNLSGKAAEKLATRAWKSFDPTKTIKFDNPAQLYRATRAGEALGNSSTLGSMIDWGVRSGPITALTNAGGIYGDLKEQGYSDEEIAQSMRTMMAEELPQDFVTGALTGFALNGKLGRVALGKTPKKASRLRQGVQNFALNAPLEVTSEYFDEANQQRLQDKYTNKEYGEDIFHLTDEERAAGASAAAPALIPGFIGGARNVATRGRSLRQTYSDFRNALADRAIFKRINKTNEEVSNAVDEANEDFKFLIDEDDDGGNVGGDGGNIGGNPSSGGSAIDTTSAVEPFMGQRMDNGENGCVEAVTKIGANGGNAFLKTELDNGVVSVPKLVEDAGDKVVPYDENNVSEGDLIVYGDNDHVVMADGKGGYVGNSSSQQKVIRGDNYLDMGGLKPTKIIKLGGTSTSSGSTTSKGGSYSGDANIDSTINAMAEKYNIPPALLAAVAEQESGFNPNAQSGAGAIGIMQLMPDTAKGLGVDPNDVAGNIEGGAKYLRQMLDMYDGNVEKALAAYNAGPGNLDKANGDISNLSEETRNYVPSVMEKYNKFGGSNATASISNNTTNVNTNLNADDVFNRLDDGFADSMLMEFSAEAEEDGAYSVPGIKKLLENSFEDGKMDRQAILDEGGDQFVQFLNDVLEKSDIEIARRVASMASASHNMPTYSRVSSALNSNDTPVIKQVATKYRNSVQRLLSNIESARTNQTAQVKTETPSHNQQTTPSQTQSNNYHGFFDGKSDEEVANTRAKLDKEVNFKSGNATTKQSWAEHMEGLANKDADTVSMSQNGNRYYVNNKAVPKAAYDYLGHLRRVNAEQANSNAQAEIAQAQARAMAEVSSNKQERLLQAEALINQAKLNNIDIPQKMQPGLKTGSKKAIKAVQKLVAPSLEKANSKGGNTNETQSTNAEKTASKESINTTDKVQYTESKQGKETESKDEVNNPDIETGTHIDTRNGNKRYKASIHKKINDRKRLNALAQKHHGGYSNFAKAYLFKKESDRNAFVADVNKAFFNKENSKAVDNVKENETPDEGSVWGRLIDEWRPKTRKALSKAKDKLANREINLQEYEDETAHEVEKLINAISKNLDDVHRKLLIKDIYTQAEIIDKEAIEKRGSVNGTYDKWQKIIDDYEDVLVDKYKDESVTFDNSKLSVNEVRHGAILMALRDKVGNQDDSAYVEDVLSRLKTFDVLTRDEVKKVLMKFIHGENIVSALGEKSELDLQKLFKKVYAEIANGLYYGRYNGFYKNGLFPSDFMDIDLAMEVAKAWPDTVYGVSPKPALQQAYNIANAVMGKEEQPDMRNVTNEAEKAEPKELEAPEENNPQNTTDEAETTSNNEGDTPKETTDEPREESSKEDTSTAEESQPEPTQDEGEKTSDHNNTDGYYGFLDGKKPGEVREIENSLNKPLGNRKSDNAPTNKDFVEEFAGSGQAKEKRGRSYIVAGHTVLKAAYKYFEHLESIGFKGLEAQKADHKAKIKDINKQLINLEITPSEAIEKINQDKEVFKNWLNGNLAGKQQKIDRALVIYESELKMLNAAKDGRNIAPSASYHTVLQIYKDRVAKAETKAETAQKQIESPKGASSKPKSMVKNTEKAKDKKGTGTPSQSVKQNDFSVSESTEESKMGRPLPKGGTGKTVEVLTDSGKPIQVRYHIVNIGKVVTSNLPTSFFVNKKYPSSLQPRNRQRVAMQNQVESMANSLRPKDLAEGRNLNQGAPIVRSDGVVLNGNGRALAIMTAYANGKADSYRGYILEHAEELGLSKKDISNIRKSKSRVMLVREVVGSVDKDTVTAITESTVGGSRLGAGEQAQIDAKKITPNVFDEYVPNENNDITAPSNRNFVNAVLAKIINENDSNAYTDSAGNVNKDGIERVKRALCAMAYGDSNVIDKMAESTDDNIANVSKALIQSAPLMAQVKSMIDKGEYQSYNISETISNAVNRLNSIKNGSELTVEEYLIQQGLISEYADSNETKEIVKAFNDYRRSAKKITAFISKIGTTIKAEPKPSETSFDFGGVEKALPLSDIIGKAREYVDSGKYKSDESLLSLTDELNENEGLNAEDFEPAVKEAFPNATNFTKDGNEVTFALPNGSKVTVNLVDGIAMTDADRNRASSDYGRAVEKNEVAEGSYHGVGRDGFIELAKGGRIGTIFHEAYHFAKATALNEKEKTFLSKRYKNEEQEAEAYREWRLARNRKGMFGKIWNKIQDVANKMAEVLGVQTKGNIFRDIESGKVFESDNTKKKSENISKKQNESSDEEIHQTEKKYSILTSDNSSEGLKTRIAHLFNSFNSSKGKKDYRKMAQGLLEDLTQAKIRWGRLDKDMDVIFKKAEGVLRASKPYDWATLMPEVGGAVAERLGLKPTKRMKNYIADWILTGAYNNNSSEARAFKNAMQNNAYVADKLVETKNLFIEHADKKTHDFHQDMISFSKPEVKNRLGKFLDDFYSDFVEELHPLENMEKAIEKKTGYKIKPHISPYRAFRMLRGYYGKVAAMLEGDRFAKEALAEFYPNVDFSKFKPLRQILKEIGATQNNKERYKAFGEYCVKMHVMDIHAFNKKNAETIAENEQEIERMKKEGRPAKEYRELERENKKLRDSFMETPYTEDECLETIKKVQAENPAFVQGQKDVVAFSNTTLEILYDSGRISDKRLDNTRSKWPNYVPMFREFDENEELNFGDSMKAQKGSTRTVIDPIQSIIRNTNVFIKQAETNICRQKLADLAQCSGVGEYIELVGEEGRHDLGDTLPVYINGKRKYLVTDPSVVKAVYKMDRDNSGAFIKLLQVPVQLGRACFVLINPSFAIRNLFRDGADAAIYSKYGFTPKDMASGFIHSLNEDKTFWQWMIAGGAQASSISADRDYTESTIDKLTRTKWERIKANDSILNNGILRALQAAGEYSEYATRVGAFEKNFKNMQSKEGRTTRDAMIAAAFESRDLMDFARGGRNSRTLNKISLFSNAAIQGWDKFFRTFDPRDKKTFMRATARLVLTAMLPALTLSLLFRGDTWWEELPDWMKENNWVFKVGDTIIRVPKGQDIATKFFSNFIEKGISKTSEMDEKLLDPLYDALPSLVPFGLLPIAEVASNHSFFTKGKVVPGYMEKLPDDKQYDTSTSFLSKFLGESIGYSPKKIDHLLKGYFGNVYGGVGEFINFLGRDRKSLPTTTDLPVVQGVTYMPYKNPASVTKFYEEWDKMQKEHTLFKQTGKARNGYNESEYKKMQKVNKALTELSRKERAVVEDERLSNSDRYDKQMAIQQKRLSIVQSLK